MEVVVAIIVYQRKVLALQRQFSSDKDISYKYEFPGGKIEKNENETDALKRELLEELDLEINNFSKFIEIQHKYSKKMVFLKCYLCEIEKLNFKLLIHKKYKLLDRFNIFNEDWLEGDYPIIQHLIEKNII